jgi:hypothetical protein
MSDQEEMSFTVDFSEVADLGPVPQGRYEASIVTAKAGVSQSGYPKIDVGWKIESEEFEGRQIFDTIAFHPNALPMTKRKLVQMGFPSDFSGDFTPEDLLGVTATLVVSIQQSTQINDETGEPYDPRNKINKILDASSDLESVL